MPQCLTRLFACVGQRPFLKLPAVGLRLGDQRLAKRFDNWCRFVVDLFAQPKVAESRHRVAELGQADFPALEPTVARLENQVPIHVAVKAIPFMPQLECVPIPRQIVAGELLVKNGP